MEPILPDPPEPPVPPSRRHGPDRLVPDPATVPRFDVAGLLRRARRNACISQREMAEAIGVSQSTIARGERDGGSIRVPVLLAVLAVGGIDLIAVDAEEEVSTMRTDELRDRGGRKLPAHLHARVATHAEMVPGHWAGAHRRNSAVRWTMRKQHRINDLLPLHHPGPEDLVIACRDDPYGWHRRPDGARRHDQALPTHSSLPSANTCRFHTGSRFFTSSTSAAQAANASTRCAADTAAASATSPIASIPTRCETATAITPGRAAMSAATSATTPAALGWQ